MDFIVPTDSSPDSDAMIERVVQYCKSIGISPSYCLVNTYLVKTQDPDKMVQANDDLKRTSQESLNQQVNRLKKLSLTKDVSFRTISYMGSLHNVLVCVAGKEKARGIIIGNAKLLNERILSEVVAKSPCPVWIIGEKDGV